MAVVKPGRIMFEIAGVPRARAEEALRRAAMKMPMECKFVERVSQVPMPSSRGNGAHTRLHDRRLEDGEDASETMKTSGRGDVAEE